MEALCDALAGASPRTGASVGRELGGDPTLGHAANLLYMMTGRKPTADEAKVMDVSLILYAEHEFNASTFTTRVIAGTLSDMHGAVCGGIAALKGPLHGGANEAYIQSSVTNNLLGFQLGGRADYFITPRFSVFAAPKVGIYGNDMNVQGRIYTGDGLVGMDVTGSKVGFSMMGQLDVGMNYQFSPRWSVFGGYRLVAVSGLAICSSGCFSALTPKISSARAPISIIPAPR